MSNKKIYKCPECGFHYADFKTMQLCKKWCSQNKSCNPEITKFSIELFKK